jgi:hypothetical protein
MRLFFFYLTQNVINFFLERYDENSIDGIKRIDYQETNPTEIGYELFLFNKNNLKLSAILLKNELFLKKDEYDKYLITYLEKINDNLNKQTLTPNVIDKETITNIIKTNITSIETNESFLLLK